MAEISESIDVLLSRQIEGIIYIGVHPRDVTGIIRKLISQQYIHIVIPQRMIV